jgi:acetyl esterase/lipase
MPFALALLAFFLSIWIVVPGPIVPPFILTVAGNEFWLTLTFFAAIVMFIALRSRGQLRPAAIMTTLAALLCTLVPPLACAIRGPYAPLSALLTPLAERASAIAVRPGAPVVLAIYGGA